MADAGLVGGARHLEGHGAPVGDATGFKALQPSWWLKEVRRINSGRSRRAQVPDVDVAEAGRITEGPRLVVALDAGVAALGEKPSTSL